MDEGGTRRIICSFAFWLRILVGFWSRSLCVWEIDTVIPPQICVCGKLVGALGGIGRQYLYSDCRAFSLEVYAEIFIIETASRPL